MLNIDNMVILTGNLGADSEMSLFDNGRARVKFRLATSKSFKDKTGEVVKKSQWHNCVLWGPRAEKLASWLKKGRSVTVLGSIEYSLSEKDGIKKYFTDIVVEEIRFNGPRQDVGTDAGGSVPHDDYTETPFDAPF